MMLRQQQQQQQREEEEEASPTEKLLSFANATIMYRCSFSTRLEEFSSQAHIYDLMMGYSACSRETLIHLSVFACLIFE